MHSYPQAVARKSGATGTIPYSQYYFHNHEEDNDNFAGADHLDLDFMYGGWEANPDVEERTRRLNAAVADTGWPLVQQHHLVLPSEATVLLMSSNLFHRAARREDDSDQESLERPRFMFRFLLYRTTDPAPASGPARTSAEESHVRWTQTRDELTGIDLSETPDDCTVVWDDARAWAKGEAPPVLTSIRGDPPSIAELSEQLGLLGEAQEWRRMGAAHKLARLGQQGSSRAAAEALGKGISSERESLRRAAMYGASAMGGDVMASVLLGHIHSDAKWRRKAAAFALGEGAPLVASVVEALCTRLQEDESVYVRSTAAFALGCLYRRSVASAAATVGREGLQTRIIAALLEGLAVEENRLDQGLREEALRQKANHWGAKMWRPTDLNDVCEGGAVVPPAQLLAAKGLPPERFEPVCSAVRGNIGMALVMVATHPVPPPALSELVAGLSGVIRSDKNVATVGYCMDALHRLARHGGEVAVAARGAVLDGGSCLLPKESLCRTLPCAT